jgi:hypothetical protein
MSAEERRAMKQKMPRRMLAGGILLLGISTAVSPQLQNGRYDQGNQVSIAQSAPANFSADAKYDIGAYPSFPPKLAAGDGQQETLSFCSQCHSTRYITMQPPLPAETWEAEVNKMIKTFGAPIPDAPAKKIILFLQQNYTSETRKR